MGFLRRDGRPPGRLAAVRVGLIFLAAGTWLAGVVAERRGVTAAAIGILLLALVLRLVDRRPGSGGEHG